jgi:seryl-tRNA synthetase
MRSGDDRGADHARRITREQIVLGVRRKYDAWSDGAPVGVDTAIEEEADQIWGAVKRWQDAYDTLEELRQVPGPLTEALSASLAQAQQEIAQAEAEIESMKNMEDDGKELLKQTMRLLEGEMERRAEGLPNILHRL